jgi:hypothetical protein
MKDHCTVSDGAISVVESVGSTIVRMNSLAVTRRASPPSVGYQRGFPRQLNDNYHDKRNYRKRFFHKVSPHLY